jgi:ketosteroid isomerase-like protein
MRGKCLILLLAGCLAGCGDAPDPDFETLVRKHYLAPYKSGDIDEWLAIFADDAVGMHNTVPPLEGIDALRDFGEKVHENLRIEQLDVTVDEVRRSGDWAYTRGGYAALFVPTDAPADAEIPTRHGKYFLLWERQPDGSWKILIDMGNSNEPANR